MNSFKFPFIRADSCKGYGESRALRAPESRSLTSRGLTTDDSAHDNEVAVDDKEFARVSKI